MGAGEESVRVALPAVIATAVLAAHDPTARISDFGGETMGTRWTVRAVLPAGLPPETVRAAIVDRLDGIVGQMSHWLPTSLLSRFNRADAGHWTTLPPDFAHVIARGLAIAAATQGAFDPTIGRIVDLRGFGPTPAAAPPVGHARGVGSGDVPAAIPANVPADDPADDPAGDLAGALAEALADAGWQRLTFSAGDRRLRQPGGLSLDLSGIAKGFAVDAVAAVLDRLGIRHALTEIGGEFVGRGIRPDGLPWWVDLETPPGCTLAPLRVALHGIAVATSGDYRRGAHTIDPRTGCPVDNGVVSVSVLHDDALTADAWATALTVLGPGQGKALATAHGIAARIVTLTRGTGTQETGTQETGTRETGTRETGEAREYLTPALRAMLAD